MTWELSDFDDRLWRGLEADPEPLEWCAACERAYALDCYAPCHYCERALTLVDTLRYDSQGAVVASEGEPDGLEKH